MDTNDSDYTWISFKNLKHRNKYVEDFVWSVSLRRNRARGNKYQKR